MFFFKYGAASELDTLSLHDALPISRAQGRLRPTVVLIRWRGLLRAVRVLLGDLALALGRLVARPRAAADARSEEHTSELQSRGHLVCRLLLEKKNHRISKYG